MKRGDPYDWAAIRAAWESYAESCGKHPRDCTRDELKTAIPGFGHAVDTYKESSRERGARHFRDAKAELFPPSVPAPVHPRGHYLKGVSSFVDGEGNLRRQWIKTDKAKEAREDLLRRVIEEMPTLVPVRETVSASPPEHLSEDIMAVYPMGDPHVGMLAWHGDAETDFDLKTVERLMLAAAHYLATQGGPSKRAALINLGDYFHANDQTNRTPGHGHQLDVDSRYGKTIRVGLRIAICMIEVLLAHHETVDVFNAIGNHDKEPALWLAVALDAYFAKEPRVRVDLSAGAAAYLHFGKCIIGITHGDRLKFNELESTMAYDCREQWSETEHRYWYTGHIHHRSAQDFKSCTVESFRTLAARDAYAQGHGYRGRRDMQKILLHAEHGELARFIADHRLLEAA